MDRNTEEINHLTDGEKNQFEEKIGVITNDRIVDKNIHPNTQKADSDKGAEIEMELKNKFFDLIDPSKDTWVLNHSIGCIADWIVSQFASKPDKDYPRPDSDGGL